MPPRNHPDWLQAYISYTSNSEAPSYMHFWSGVSAIAGALRRKVWFDMGHFAWYPNFYIIFVAPPGIVAKSTTSGIAMNLLRQVPGIKWGPDVVTWPALVTCFAESTEAFEYKDTINQMSCLTLESSEFGNLLDPQDRKMVDLYVHLWDAKTGEFNKVTKNNGVDNVVNPWINMIACTTPAWVADNFPEYMIGGGFFSRCVFVYAEKKAKLIAYPFLEMEKEGRDMKLEEARLVDDLKQIANLTGQYKLTANAITYGQQWYEEQWDNKPIDMDEARFGGYFSRKQSHLHKLAMVLAAATSNKLLINKATLQTANAMVTDLENEMMKVVSKVGKTTTSLNVDRLTDYLCKRGRVPYNEVYRFIHSYFPSARDFEDVVAGLVNSGQIRLTNVGGKVYVEAIKC